VELGIERNHFKTSLPFHCGFFVTKSTLILNFWSFKKVISRSNYENVFGRIFCSL